MATSVTNIILEHKVQVQGGGGATLICTIQNETLMKQIQNSQKSIGKSIPASGF
jgi:hypothetical protein